MVTVQRRNKKLEDFMTKRRHWKHSRPRATVTWSEDKKKLQKHLVESARLLAKLSLPFIPSMEQIEQFEQEGLDI